MHLSNAYKHQCLHISVDRVDVMANGESLMFFQLEIVF